ncbi:MAG TPA: D-cysteine desulfhydrase family protein [Acidimicrobiales bacterium]|nr:D-cysteine desulfhydrase family protein [Acidimicrobiales bacterium]
MIAPLALSHRPTPLEPMDRLASALGMRPGQLFVKRDDCTGLAGGGNKARKLDYLCADALAAGADTLVTGGGRQSNHVRMTIAAANRLGLHAVAVLSSAEPKTPSGNVVLDHILAPEFVWAGPLAYYPLEERIAAVCDELRAAGRAPYHIPIGGATPLGALGYLAAADEIVEQLGEVPALTITADGSGGTHAGLVAGLGDHARVVGFDVGTRPDLDDVVPREAAACAALAERATPVGDVRVDHDYFGADYGAPTDAAREALHLFATCEGLVLDPVYTGKAAAGFVDYARTGRLPDGPVVFVHTGGMPALFANAFSEWVKAPR